MKKILRVISVIIVIAICFAPASFAASNSIQSSDYLIQYDAYIITNGNGSISIWFDVTGTRIMDEIGALTIILREYNGSTWSTVEAYYHTDPLYSHILTTGTNTHMDTVSYSGISGSYYYATVTVWAGVNGGGDSRTINTATVVA